MSAYTAALELADRARHEGNTGDMLNHLDAFAWNVRGWEYAHLTAHADPPVFAGYYPSNPVFSHDGSHYADWTRANDSEPVKITVVDIGHRKTLTWSRDEVPARLAEPGLRLNDEGSRSRRTGPSTRSAPGARRD